MAKTKSIKTFAEKGCNLYNLIKANGEDPYFMEVLYYYVRRSLLRADFDLSEYEAFTINGKYLGYKLEVDFGNAFDNVIQSLSFALSVRALILNPSNIKNCYDSRLLFCTIPDFLTWESHRIIMECLDDDDFHFIYQMIVDAIEKGMVDDTNKQLFNERTIRPEFHHLEDFCKLMAKDPEYNGQSIIKNNAYLCSDIDEFVITKSVDYVGNTAFAYCENLKVIKFERKVLLGKFPIIECHNLKQIVVPTEYLEYYKEALPYYKDIIFDHEQEFELKEIEIDPNSDVVETENIVETENFVEKIEVEGYGNLEIEHVFLDNPYSYSCVEKDDNQDLKIDFSSINKIFEKKATSYKYFWFLSIISLAKERQDLNLSYNDILFRMAAMAWPIIFSYGINLGDRDMISKYLSEIQITTGLPPTVSSMRLEKYLQQNYKFQGIKSILSPLLKNVPYRFLSPWYKYTSDDDVIVGSNRKNFTGIYALKDDGIVIKKAWWDYIKHHYSEICNMSKKSLKAYISGYNDDKAVLKLFTNGISFIG